MIDEKLLENLRNLRDKIESENYEKNKEKGELNKEVTVEDIHYLGDIKSKMKLANGQLVLVSQDIYEVIEKEVIKDENGEIKKELENIKYYLDNIPVAMEYNNEIYPSEDFLENDELIDKIKENKEKEYAKEKDEQYPTLTEMEEERMEEIADTMGVSKEEVKSVAEIDPQKKIEDPQKDTRIDEEKLLKNLNIKNEFKPETNITAKDNFYDLVPGSEKFVKMYTVYSDKIPDASGSKFALVGLTKDGKMEYLPLQATKGRNTTKEMINIENTGNVDKEQVTDRLTIPGMEDKGFAFKFEQYGEISVKYFEQYRIRNNGVDEISETSIDLETNSRKPTPLRVREQMDSRYNTEREKAEKNNALERNIENNGRTTTETVDNSMLNDMDEEVVFQGSRMTVENAIEIIVSQNLVSRGPDPENNTSFQNAKQEAIEQYKKLDENKSLIEKVNEIKGWAEELYEEQEHTHNRNRV